MIDFTLSSMLIINLASNFIHLWPRLVSHRSNNNSTNEQTNRTKKTIHKPASNLNIQSDRILSSKPQSISDWLNNILTKCISTSEYVKEKTKKIFIFCSKPISWTFILFKPHKFIPTCITNTLFCSNLFVFIYTQALQVCVVKYIQVTL